MIAGVNEDCANTLFAGGYPPLPPPLPYSPPPPPPPSHPPPPLFPSPSPPHHSVRTPLQVSMCVCVVSQHRYLHRRITLKTAMCIVAYDTVCSCLLLQFIHICIVSPQF